MKMVRAKCKKVNKNMVLQVSDDGKEILGFLKVDAEAYEAMQSEVKLNLATTRFACPTCGSNKAFSCEHVYKDKKCSDGKSLDKNCITCKYLEPDYKRATRHGVIQIHAGETAVLELSRLKVGLGWDTLVDIDSSVVMCANNSYELVYFGNLMGENGCVKHRGDNLTGRDGDVAGTDDDENIDIYLDLVPSKYDRLVFVINIYTSSVNKFGAIKGLYLNIYDQESKDKLIEYRVEQNFSRNCSLVIGEARRTADGWEFLAIGEGTDIKNVRDLANYCVRKRW